MRRHVCFAINNYPGVNMDLQGCVNDANDWDQTLRSKGSTPLKKLLDAQATRRAISAAMAEGVAVTQPGDTLVITYSGHGCFTADTAISLLQGGSMTMAELHARYGHGGEFWVYAAGPDGSIVPGRAHSPRITKMAAVVQVTLDNGACVRCTADHRVMLRDGSYCAAGQLRSGDSLMPLYRRLSSKADGDGLDGYEMCYIQAAAQLTTLTAAKAYPRAGYVYTHRVVAHDCGLKMSGGRIIHHVDFHKANNSPPNLNSLTRKQHAIVHSHTEERKAANRAMCIVRNKTYSWPDAVREKVGEISSANRKKEWKRKSYRKKVIAGVKRHYAGLTAEQKRARVMPASIRGLANHKRRHEARGVYKPGCELCEAAHPVNHKVVSVVALPGVVPVYDISVDEHHNFALEAGVFVHNSWVPDEGTDEMDGRDEAWCPYDMETNGLILDDDLFSIFERRKPGAKIVMISDSCHSGTVARLAGTFGGERRARFIPPFHLKQFRQISGRRKAAIELLAGTKSKAKFEMPGVLLLSGCKDSEYSYDAVFGNRPNGAFTAIARQILAKLPARATYAEWMVAVRKQLPSHSYPQTPQISGPRASQAWQIFS